MRKALSFDDVLCVPGFSSVKSRNDVDISVAWNDLKFDSPVFCANMPTVVDLRAAIEMSKHGVTPVFHREQEPLEICQTIALFKKERPNSIVGASFGANREEVENIQDYFEYGADFLVLDVAHANSAIVLEFVSVLYKKFPNKKFIIGNFATLPHHLGDHLLCHENFAWKIGIGSGANCTTRVKTGHGLPTLDSIIQWREKNPSLFLIADGGMKNPGDVCKSMAAGANMVMLGSMLSGTKQSPGPTIKGNDGQLYKVHAGNASYMTKLNAGRETKYVEGVESLVPLKGDMKDVISDIFDGIRSGFSYSGARTVNEFREKAVLVEITPLGHSESKPHIFSK